jgi:hypothetical protein
MKSSGYLFNAKVCEVTEISLMSLRAIPSEKELKPIERPLSLNLRNEVYPRLT